MEYKNMSVPLSYMKGFDDGKIAWDVEIPDYVDDEAISLNLTSLRNISRWAGLKRLEINSGHSINESQALADYEEYEDAHSNVTIYEEDEQQKYVSSEYKWDYGEVTINNTELYANVLRKTTEEDSVADPKLWSDHLNTTIKNSLLEISRVQLTRGISTAGKLNALSVVAMGGLISLATGSPDTLIPSILGVSIINQSTSMIYHQGYGSALKDRRLSLLPSYQIDRLLVVRGILRYRDLVKVNSFAEATKESI